eukprot:c18798_g1_i1.p1 GENE.c18798_g1_i1~~c18798_g1_i1.p1  ORF type:complete len:307 (+),score=108.57 c18798_g1_i1:16-936(+)
MSLFDCFLTHNWGTDEKGRSNHDRVVKISEMLKERGINPWIDKDQIAGNIHIPTQIMKGIKDSACVVVFVTQDYQRKVFGDNQSDNCYLEFQFSAQRKTPALMIPVVMEERMRDTKKWDGLLSFYLSGLFFIEMWNDNELSQSVDRLVSTIRKMVDQVRSKNIELLKTAEGTYEGEVQQGKKHGKGVFTYNDKDREFGNREKYDGQWKNDQREGEGTLIYEDGSNYVGEWKNDNWHGKGTHTEKNDFIYEGQWENNEMHGQGIYHDLVTGDRYEGYWKNGERHGKGELHSKNRGKFSLNYCDGKEI